MIFTDPKDSGEAALEQTAPLAKFTHPDWTAKGEKRAKVSLTRLETLWINTGSLCNIECGHCYIESSPTNGRLAYLTLTEAEAFFDEIAREQLGTAEIGFTGGEPFLNKDMLAMTEAALRRGFRVLILTNAMTPMQRPAVKAGLLRLNALYGGRLMLRVSLDHYTEALHDGERGKGSWRSVLSGMRWLADNGFRMAIGARTRWQENEAETRAGFAALIAEHGWPIDAMHPAGLVLFPEMDETVDVPEITIACWGILKKSPSSVMCATSRMVIKRQGAARPVVVPCTLLPYIEAFEMGATLAEAAQADGGLFDRGAVKLCHRYCAQFCVLGGGSCAI